MSADSILVTALFMAVDSFSLARIGRAALLASEPIENHYFPEPLLDRFCRHSAPARARRHVTVHNADRGDMRSLADRNVIVQAYTRAEHNEILESGAT